MTGLFFDTETTGIYSWQNPGFKPKLVQLGAILQDLDTGRVLAELNLISQEAGDIPVEASNVHGISTELAQQMGIPTNLIDQTFAWLMLKADVVVAHNIAYDRDIVRDNLPATLKAMNDVPQFCTMQGSLYIVKSPLSDKQKAFFSAHPEKQDAPYKVPNLTETFMHFYGKPFEGAHDASADIGACRDIFLTLLTEGYYEIVEGEVVATDKLTQLMGSDAMSESLTDEEHRMDFWVQHGVWPSQARKIVKAQKPTLAEAAYIFGQRVRELAKAVNGGKR